MILLSVVCLFLQASTVVYGWCTPFTYGSWHSWDSCTHSCGGGTHRRVKYSCIRDDEKWDTDTCNEFCYYGGSFLSEHCVCKSWRTGRCCEACRHINIPHCKYGKQSCGGSPDNIRCTDCDLPYTPAGYGKGCRRLSCRERNGGCEQTCLTVRGAPVCGCKTGFKLSSDAFSCSDVDECLTGDAKCSHKCSNTRGSFICSCTDGYQLDSDGYTCSDIDECLTGDDKCEHMCINTPSSFRCACKPGFKLQHDGKTCVDLDECASKNGGCSDTCTNEQGSYRCICNTGYVLHTDGLSCRDIDECAENTHKCNQRCINVPGSYNCVCDAGYQLQEDGFVCQDIDDCAGVNCRNGGSCIDHLNSFTCDCRDGYIGRHCENDIDECVGFLQGGCEDNCTNTLGSYKCSCSGNKTLNGDGRSCSGSGNSISVFSRNGLVRHLLPRGCSTILLTRCTEGNTFDISMSSTSPWYRLNTNHSIIYTFGIVFVELNALSLPISLTGIKIAKNDGDFSVMAGSLSLVVDEGSKIGQERTDKCVSFSITPRDVIDFMKSGSFLKTFFNNLIEHLPNWLSFSPNGTEVLEMKDFRTKLLRGKDISSMSACNGAPVHDNRLYTVLQFGSSFSFGIYGNSVKLPKPTNNNEFCFIIDVCQDYGGSMFLMIPEESRGFIDNIDIFKQLKSKYGLEFRPVGLGLSLFKHVRVLQDSTHAQLWNGDELFKYPSTDEANLWLAGNVDMTIGKSFVFRMKSQTSLYASVPDPSDMLKSVFLDEWNIFMKTEVLGSIDIQFKLFNRDVKINLNVGTSELDAYASLGGQLKRNWCGENANPPGFYLSFMVDVNPFVDVPILKDIVLDFNSRMYAFLASDPSIENSLENEIDILDDILNLNGTVELFINTTVKSIFRYGKLLTNESLIMLSNLEQTAIGFGGAINELASGGGNFFKNIATFIDKVSAIWTKGWTKIEDDALEFTDSVEQTTEIVKYNFSHVIDEAINNIKEKVHKTMNKIKYQLMSVFRNLEGFGLRYKGTLKIFHIEIFGLEMEFVYSVDKLGMCSRFAHVYDLLKGEKAARIYAVVSTGVFKILPFVRLHAGAGLGFAISIDTPDKMVVQLHAEAALLGIIAQANVFLTNNGHYFSIEGNVWNTFKARLDVSFKYDDERNDHGIHIVGILLANAGDGTTFQDSYLEALQKLTTKTAEAADKRISQAEAGLTSAQNALTKAQDWLEEKKYVIRSANAAFNDAIDALERAKEKVEEAKQPFKNALSFLNEAQRKVDTLCSIRTCRQICVPGIKCEIHWKKAWFFSIPYPSCSLTSCMFSFPDPICLAFNLGCRAIRGIAYLALEVAKVAVHLPMAVLDAAKFALTGVQFVVDKSRVVLDIAEVAIDLAQFGLEGAKGVLEGAKLTLEGIKQVVGWGFKAFNFIIEYGIKSLIDVKNCGFELTIAQESNVFQIQCEINLFRTGFRKINIGVNFGNPIQSIWQASKKSIDAIIDESQHSYRRKREVKTVVINIVNRLIRKSRNANIEEESVDAFINDTLDAVSNAPGFKQNATPSDYENRVEHFKEKCSSFRNINSFLSEATQVLLEMSNETAGVLTDASGLDDSLSKFNMNEILGNFTMENIGIDPVVAGNEFNISSSDINDVMTEAKGNLSSDPLLSDIDTLSADARSLLRNQTADINNMNIVNHWLFAMDNITTEYFENNVCISFMDCAHYAVSELYSLYDAENITNMDESIDIISQFESLFLDLTSNGSHTIVDIRSITQQLMRLLLTMDELNMFCSEAPYVVLKLTNQTVFEGSTLTMKCGISGTPLPTVWWYRDEEFLPEYNEHELSIRNISRNDSKNYYCIAGNIVANLTSDTAGITVLAEEELASVDSLEFEAGILPWSKTFSAKPLNDSMEIATSFKESDSTLIISLSVSLTLFGIVASVAAVVIWRSNARRRARKESRPDSRASLASVLTSNMVRPEIRKPTFHTDKLQ